MRILLTAITCNPLTGSEAHCGWSAIQALAPHYDLEILLHEGNRPYLPDNLAKSLPRVRFHFAGHARPWHSNRMIARLQSWRNIVSWQNTLLSLAQRLHAERPFHLAHHLTMASWRVASPLWKLGIPAVWGPLGGGEILPSAFWKELSFSTKAYEMLRIGSNFASNYSPAVRACARHSAMIVASNIDTAERLAQIAGRPDIPVLSSTFFTQPRIEMLRSKIEEKDHTDVLSLFAGGNLEGRKGVALSLKALSLLKKKGIPFRYYYGGHGPESSYLRDLSKKMGLGPEVVLGASLSGKDYVEKLHQSQVYLSPSLRDNAPVTLMEAMLAGCVPIVAHCGGPGTIVTDSCGFRIAPQDPQDMVVRLAEALTTLHHDRTTCRRLGQAASLRIRDSYSDTFFLEAISRIYERALQCGH